MLNRSADVAGMISFISQVFCLKNSRSFCVKDRTESNYLLLISLQRGLDKSITIFLLSSL